MATDFVLDKARILVRLGGDEEIFAIMADMYIQDVDNSCLRLAGALDSGDAPTLRREAHTVKGLLATFADEAGAALALEVETGAKGGECAALAGQVADLQSRLQLVAAVVRREIGA